jgi:hypothetical protein
MTATDQHDRPVSKPQPLDWLKVITDQVAMRLSALSGQLPPDSVMRKLVPVTRQ